MHDLSVSFRHHCLRAAELEQRWLDGDAGDGEFGSTSEGSGMHCVLYGREVLLTDSQGFVYALKFDTSAEAAETIYTLTGEVVVV